MHGGYNKNGVKTTLYKYAWVKNSKKHLTNMKNSVKMLYNFKRNDTE